MKKESGESGEQTKVKTKYSYSYTPKKPDNAIDASHWRKVSVSRPKSVDLRLYRFTQPELRNHIKQVLKSKKIDFTEYDGNLYSIRFPERPVFVAHMDIVQPDSVKKPMYMVPDEGTLHRDGGTLGADDRAGVNLLLNHIDTINFVFTRDEEIGCQGMHSLETTKEFLDAIDPVPCLIEPDRRGCRSIGNKPLGTGDIIQYCDEDLIEEITSILPDYSVANGSYTDIACLDDIKPAVNLSCGYYSAHTTSEYLDIAEFEYLDSKIEALNAIRGEFNIKPPTKWQWVKKGTAKTKESDYKDPESEYWHYLGYTSKEEFEEDMDLDDLVHDDEGVDDIVALLPGNLKAEAFDRSTTCDLCGYYSKAITLTAGFYICAHCCSDIVKDTTR